MQSLCKKSVAILAVAVLVFGLVGCNNGKSFKEYEGLPELQVASYYGDAQKGGTKLKMKAKYTDKYTFAISSEGSTVEIYDENGKCLAKAAATNEVSLSKDDIVYVKVDTKSAKVRLNVRAEKNRYPLPFDTLDFPDEEYDLYGDSSIDPLTAATVNYVKREGGLYVYSNTPEALDSRVFNRALTRDDVTDKEVFFTFEHQSEAAGEDGYNGLYYGYRVYNTGNEDAFVTVKNVGYQQAGPGAYYGQKEWANFYNTAFALPDMSKWNEEQKELFKLYFNFGDTQGAGTFQPTTYRIPAGKFIYAIGGTTEDAYNKYDVGGTANKRVNGNCQNGAVLFEVHGKAEAAFFVYTDPEEIAEYDGSIHGMLTEFKFGRGCQGSENRGIVVDNSCTWTFNDKTPAQALPYTYKTYHKDYKKGESLSGTPLTPIGNTERIKNNTCYYTHVNPNLEPDAVYSDMTTFHTEFDGKPLVIDLDNYDVTGKPANMGNWMKDYIDAFTFVNQGDKDRKVTVKLSTVNGGSLCAMVRDEHGNLIKGTEVFTFVREDEDKERNLDPLTDWFFYTVTVKAHSVLRFNVEYNLMANSTGSVSHEVFLDFDDIVFEDAEA